MYKNIFGIMGIILAFIAFLCLIIARGKAYSSMKKIQKGEILYKCKINKWVYILYLLPILMIVSLIITGWEDLSLKRCIPIVTLLPILFMPQPTTFIITSEGIGLGDKFSEFINFASWNDIKSLHWNKFDNKILNIQTEINSFPRQIFQFKFKESKVSEINNVLEKCNAFKQ